MKKSSGSITVFLALMMTLLVSLVCAGLSSVRNAAARTQILNGVDIGLFSLFSQYDRTLLDKYDIFALDASGGDGMLDMASLYREYETYMLPVLAQNSQRLDVLQGGFSGLSLLTDSQGEVFYRQVVEYMSETLAVQGLQALQSRLSERRAHTASAEAAGQAVEDGQSMEHYDQEMENAAARSRDAEQNSTGDLFSSGPSAENAGPDETINPIPVIRRIRQMGLLGLVLPPDRVLSGVSVDENILLSRRRCQKGYGLEDWGAGGFRLFGDLLFSQYMIQKLGTYLHPASSGLRYQIEYAIGKRMNDEDNLEKVARRLLLIREGVNAAYLRSDPFKMAQIRSLAAAISAGFAIPPAAAAVEAALVLCWAFGESILDLRELFSGGKVPLAKNEINWQLSLDNLPNLLKRLDIDRKTDPYGLSYDDYLQILLVPVSRADKTMAALDMIELTLRDQPGWTGFRLDSCVVAVGTYVEVLANQTQVLMADRIYGYL